MFTSERSLQLGRHLAPGTRPTAPARMPPRFSLREMAAQGKHVARMAQAVRPFEDRRTTTARAIATPTKSGRKPSATGDRNAAKKKVARSGKKIAMAPSDSQSYRERAQQRLEKAAIALAKAPTMEAPVPKSGPLVGLHRHGDAAAEMDDTLNRQGDAEPATVTTSGDASDFFGDVNECLFSDAELGLLELLLADTVDTSDNDRDVDDFMEQFLDEFDFFDLFLDELITDDEPDFPMSFDEAAREWFPQQAEPSAY